MSSVQAIHLVSISDLHLSATQMDRGTSPKVTEGFFYDEIFARFTQYLIAWSKDIGGNWRLLILGDGFDFLHTRTHPTVSVLSPASTFHESRLKLDLIFDAHPQFFNSLGHLLANGFHIDIVPGNHDIELIRPDTQSHFKSLMERYAPADIISKRLTFFNWLYHIPGILYAEHGNQYHTINSFVTLLSPLKNYQTGTIEYPIGAYFDLYLLHLSTCFTAPQEYARDLPQYIFRAMWKHPLTFMWQLPAHLYFLGQATKFILYRANPWLNVKRQKYRRTYFPRYAEQVGFDFQTLATLDAMAAIPSTRLFGHALDKLFPPRSTNKTYIQKLAQKIHFRLKKVQKDTMFYLFGHSHIPAKIAIDEKSYYLNDGAWTSNEFPGKPGNKVIFPYIHICWGDGIVPNAELLTWKANEDYSSLKYDV